MDMELAWFGGGCNGCDGSSTIMLAGMDGCIPPFLLFALPTTIIIVFFSTVDFQSGN